MHKRPPAHMPKVSPTKPDFLGIPNTCPVFNTAVDNTHPNPKPRDPAQLVITMGVVGQVLLIGNSVVERNSRSYSSVGHTPEKKVTLKGGYVGSCRSHNASL